MKLRCDWRAASTTKFKPDNVRRNAVVFRKKRLTCVITKKNENSIDFLKNWMIDNEVKQYEMSALYEVNKQTGEVFYHGLVFDFTDETDCVMFKLSCM
jgi:hypothetical protein